MSQQLRPSASIHPFRIPATRSVQITYPANRIASCTPSNQVSETNLSMEAIQHALALGLITASEADDLIFLAKICIKQRTMCQILQFPRSAR